MISDTILLQGLTEMQESGYLEIEAAYESRLLANLTNKLATVDYRDHLELVKTRGMIEGIKFLQAERSAYLNTDRELSLTSNKSAAGLSKGRKN